MTSDNKWKQLSNIIVKEAAKLSFLDLLGIVSELLDETNKKLDKIDSKLSQLMKSHFIKGMYYLSDAASNEAISDPQLRRQLVNEARQSFTEAASIKETLLMEAKASEMVGICYELLNKESLALEWYERAYTAAYKGLLEIDKKYDKVANGFLRSMRKEFEHTAYWSILLIPLGLLSDATDPANYQLSGIERERNEYREYLVALTLLLTARVSQHSLLKSQKYFEDDSNFSFDEPTDSDHWIMP